MILSSAKMNSKDTNILTSMPPKDRSRLLGDILTLMTASETHQDYKVKHFPQSVLIPVQLNQFRIYHDEAGKPVGFASWACMSEEVKERFMHNNPVLTLEDYASGDIVVFMEFIAPFGHIKQMVRDLRQRFRGQTMYAIRFDGERLENKRVSAYIGYKSQ